MYISLSLGLIAIAKQRQCIVEYRLKTTPIMVWGAVTPGLRIDTVCSSPGEWNSSGFDVMQHTRVIDDGRRSHRRARRAVTVCTVVRFGVSGGGVSDI